MGGEGQGEGEGETSYVCHTYTGWSGIPGLMLEPALQCGVLYHRAPPSV